jgi:hypothetical protein
MHCRLVKHRPVRLVLSKSKRFSCELDGAL